MTDFGLRYLSFQETKRSNLANEFETNRHNTEMERETNRSNLAKELETNRHNTTEEKEKHRSNEATEREKAMNNAVSEWLNQKKTYVADLISATGLQQKDAATIAGYVVEVLKSQKGSWGKSGAYGSVIDWGEIINSVIKFGASDKASSWYKSLTDASRQDLLNKLEKAYSSDDLYAYLKQRTQYKNMFKSL